MSTLLAPDAPTASRWRFTRSTTNLREAAALHQSDSAPSHSPRTRTSPAPTMLERAPSSKLSIFSLFTRPKVERARGHSEVGLAVPMQPQQPPQPPPKPASQIAAPKSSLRQNPSLSSQQSIRARSSQMFRPTSMRPMTPHREFGDWEPPPLFQAFSLSMKHATVLACVFPPEVLMRSQSQRRQAHAMRDRIDSARDLSTIAENGGADAKQADKNHRRLISNTILSTTTPELVNKIYILATTGYILQYAGEGPFDRTPEKILKLGKDSAAFACDLIPGKHWVLQISSHAHNDGTFETGPKNSLLSRLRTQNAAASTTTTTTSKSGPATSFLLVLDSAEEMDAWMSAIRKEIDTLAGIKTNPDSLRASSSTDDSAGHGSAETTSRRFMVQRDAETISKVTPWETTPVVSQRSDSPRIVTSDLDTDASVRSLSVAESTSGQSHHRGVGGNNRQSEELSSVASTPVSQHQVQLEGLRGRSRFSFMSTATSTSGPGTRNTSRDSSPALPASPPRNGDAEPLRSAMSSLRSFHMNPSSGSASRRRSMQQPLPTTNENFPQAIMHTPVKHQRHSLHSSPASQNTSGPDEESAEDSEHARMNSQSWNANAAPLRDASEPCPEDPIAPREDSPVRVDARTFGIPPRRDVISPPPREPAPLAPPPRSQSAQGISPTYSSQSGSLFFSGPLEAKALRRISTTPKPFLRPLPVRPQAQHADGSMVVPRRQSSLAPTTAPAPLPFGINVNRSVTAPAQTPSASANNSPTSSPNLLQSAMPLRRPVSVQIRSDPAPFLSSSRPVRAISSTPSFVPGQRASNTQNLAFTTRPLQSVPSIETLRQQALAHRSHMQTMITPKRSMPGMGLPPPAPPPTMPLPTLPPNMPLPPTPPTMSSQNGSSPTPPHSMPPPSMCLPSTPPTMPSPTPPPSMPLPPTPPEAAAAAKILAA